MRSLIAGCCLLLSSYVWGEDSMKAFLQKLPERQKTLLAEFFSHLKETTPVLQGQRPMSIEICDAPTLRFLTSPNTRTVSLVKGRELWEDLKVVQENKEIVLLTPEIDNQYHFITIQRKRFLQTVEENLALFQYILGPAVTAENLLSEFIASKNPYEVLQNNQVLLEILLGCERHEAIAHSRLQDLANSYSTEEEFPFISKKLSRTWAFTSNKYRKKPSFGFHSLVDEEMFLSQLTAASEKITAPDAVEPKSIVELYEKSRSKLLETFRKKDFLEETLHKFFTTTFHTLEFPSTPKEREPSIPMNKEEIALKLAEIIHKKIEMEPYSVQKFKTAFIQGVAAREKGKQMPIPHPAKRISPVQEIERELQCCQNLDRADAYFQELALREDLKALFPNELYFKTIKPGKGETASTKTQRVSFQYTFQILGENRPKDWGIVKQEPISALIPGLAYALLGMQRDEERVVYIHPKYAYGENTFYPPNVSLVVQVRLLDFAEGEQAVSVLPAHQLEKRDYKELLAKFEVLRGEELFEEGVEFWDSMKKNGDFIPFSTFQKLFTTLPEKGRESSLNLSDSGKFIIDLFSLKSIAF